MSFEFDQRGGFRFPQDNDHERHDRFREDIGFGQIERILAPVLQTILPGAQQAIYPQYQYGQFHYQQTADQIASSMRMGRAEDAANLLQYELSTNPYEAPAVIARAQQETQFDSRDRLVTGQDGSLQIQDIYTGQTTFAGWLPDNVAGNYWNANDGNQWQYQTNLQPYLNPGYRSDYGDYTYLGNNGYNNYNYNYNQFNPAQTAIDMTFGTIGGLALGSLFRNSGDHYGYRSGYTQQQWHPTQQYTGQNTAQQYQPTQTYRPTTGQYHPTRQHDATTSTAQQYQPTQTYTPTTAGYYHQKQQYTPTTNTAQQYHPAQSYTAAINTAQQYHPNPYSSTTIAQQYHPAQTFRPTISTVQTQPAHQWTPAAVSHPANVTRTVVNPVVNPHAVVAATPPANQPKHA